MLASHRMGSCGLAVFLAFGIATLAQADPASASALHKFRGVNGGGVYPSGALVQHSDGNLYGTTSAGGQYDAGTVFRQALDGTFETMTGFGLLEGNGPVGDLVEGSDGDLLGVTTFGGEFNGGTIFRMWPTGEKFVLYSFDTGTWGGQPESGMIRSRDGSFYGVTPEGGLGHRAMLYRMTEGGEFSIVAQLTTECSGYGASRLVEGGDGHFYGVTSGQSNDCIFRANRRGESSVLHRFAMRDTPIGVTLGSDGKLYGTTWHVAPTNVCGSVFSFSPAGEYTTIHEFACTPQREFPFSGLTEGPDGWFQGSFDLCGSECVKSVIYRVAPDGRYEQGKIPPGVGHFVFDQILASDGNWYAVSSQGGSEQHGTVLRIVEGP